MSSAITFKTIDITKDADRALLAEAYEGVFIPAFPKEDDRESLEQLESYLREDDGRSRTFAIVAGRNLDDPHSREIMALSTCSYFRDSATGSLAYNAVAPQYRDQGLGKAMVGARLDAMKRAAQEDGTTFQGAFIDIHDPRKTSAADDSMDPALRKRIFEKWGARHIPFDAVWPALEEGKPRLYNFITLAYPNADGTYPDSKAVLGYYGSIFKNFGIDDPSGDVDFQAMKKQLAAWKSFDAAPAEKPLPAKKRAADLRA
jgi:hypothetical protein